MAWEDEEDNTIYQVVVNHEEQYSIWPDYKPIPDGWRAVGKSGKKEECLAYVMPRFQSSLRTKNTWSSSLKSGVRA
jgi:uncharacterized protein YbdZ (MbtH family)